MAVGMATTKVRKEKIMEASSACPDTNMWWPQTRKLMIAMATDDRAIAL